MLDIKRNSRKKVSNIPLKVTAGYVFLSVMLALSLLLVYGNTQALMRIGKAETQFIQRRNMVDSLVTCFFEANNHERAVYLRIANEKDYETAINRTLQLADSLKRLYRKSGKIDTLRQLLLQKLANTRALTRQLHNEAADTFYQKKVSKLREGVDTVLIHSQRPKEAEETVYEVVKPKTGFFARLADVFRKQKRDTLSVRKRAIQDSAQMTINIAGQVAGALAQIKDEEARAKVKQRQRIRQQARELQLMGMLIAERIEQLLREIRNDEHSRLQQALAADFAARKSVMYRIFLLTGLSLLMSGVLLFQIWKDSKRERKYRDSLIRAKLATERLTMTITHDIKAPAASISGFAELMDDGLKQNLTSVEIDRLKSYLARMRESARHLLNLVQALLEFHRLEQGQVEQRMVTFGWASLVKGCTEAMQPQAMARKIELRCDIEGNDCLCRGDAFRIRQILENLLSNALKYTDEGEVRVRATLRGNRLDIIVADTGKGMTDEEQKRIFDAFARLGNAQGIEGVGLGLSITREFVKLLRGTLSVESEVGKGSAFQVNIPLERLSGTMNQQPSDVSASNQESMGQNRKPKKILVLDDDALQLQLLEALVRQLDKDGGRCELHTFNRVDEAAGWFEQSQPDICLIDLEMPAASGIEVMHRLREIHPSAFVAMTAHNRSIEPRLRDEGFEDCLFKPIQKEALARVLMLEVKMTATETSVSDRFSALLAFAAGDKAAENEILHHFASDLENHLAQLRVASTALDRKSIAHTAHKSLPTLRLVEFEALGDLQQLTPEQIDKLSDMEVRQCLGNLLASLEQWMQLVQTRLKINNP